MKRLFALLLSIAMVGSLFVGSAFAIVEATHKINLDKSHAVLSGDTYGTFRITGTIRSREGTLKNADIPIKLYEETDMWWDPLTTPVYSGIATGGRINFLIETQRHTPVTYVLFAFDGDEIDPTIYPADFRLLYDVVITNPLEFSYSATDQTVISGTVKYADGSAVQHRETEEGTTGEVSLVWLHAGYIESIYTSDSGQFGFIVEGWGDHAGFIGIVVDNHLHRTGMVRPLSMDIAAEPNAEIIHTITDTEVEFTVSEGPQDGDVNITVFKGSEDGTEVTEDFRYWNMDGWDPLQGDEDFPTNSDGEATIKLKSEFNAEKAGTYIVVVESSDGLYNATTTLTVINPARINLVDPTEALKEFEVGSNRLIFGEGNYDEFGTEANIRIVEIDANGELVKDEQKRKRSVPFVYTIYVDGKIAHDARLMDRVDSEYPDLVDDSEVRRQELTMIEVVTEDLTVIPLRIVAERVSIPEEDRHPSDYTYTVVYDKTFNVPVAGWDVNYDVETLTVGQKDDVTFIVKDKDGNFVNNAEIILTHPEADEQRMSPLQTNIQNGTYVFEDIEYSEVGDVKVVVQVLNDDTKKRAEYTQGIRVVGEDVYTVTSDVATMLLGQKQKVLLTVSDADGTFIPDKVEIVVDGSVVKTPALTYKDTNNDGRADSVEIEEALTSIEPTVIRASTDNGTKMGEVVIDVVAPTLVATGNLNITEHFKTKLTFKIVDPRTNTPLNNRIYFLANYFNPYSSYGYMENEEGQDIEGILSGQDEYTVFITVSGADWAAAEADQEDVEFTLYTKMDDSFAIAGTMPVTKATLTSTPDSVLIGLPNNMTLTYTDGNGNPLEGYDVYLGDDSNGILIAETNDAGQVFYALAQAASTAVQFAAETDGMLIDGYFDEDVIGTPVFAKLTVPAGFDSAPPVISAPATTEDATALITITDNVRVVRLMVNGVEMNIFPLPEHKHLVNLEPGANTFTVVAMDANYNVTEATVTITRSVAVTNLETTIGERGYSVNGVFTDIAAPYYKGEVIMMPLRMLEGLGAVVTWDGDTETATMVYGDNTVTVTIGSVDATVNGVTKVMPSSPEISSGNTMIPTGFVSEELGFAVDWVTGPPDKLVVSPN